MCNTVYDPVSEWEYLDFPIEITNLKFEKNLHSFHSSSKIKIWRDTEYKLKAEISGYILNPNTLEEDKRQEGPGSFAELDTITGHNATGEFIFILSECVVGSFHWDGIFYPDHGVPFVADLHINSFSKKPDSIDESANENKIHYDWFICARVSLHYSGMTRRFIKDKPQKLRVGIDPDVNTDNFRPLNSSWDFFTINTPEVKCIVSKVPEEIKLNWAKCICIEYRTSFGSIPSDDIKKAIQNFLGFLFGSELLNIGTTIFLDDTLKYQKAISPRGNDAKHKCQNGSMPPVFFNMEHPWGKIQYLVDSLFPKYLEYKEKLNLDGILWRYFQAKDLTVGVNLPVLSSALELLATTYLKANKLLSPTYLPEQDYHLLIDDEIKQIQAKLAHIPEHNKILNKIKSAHNRGANEKIEFFFKSIDLPLSKIETDALRSRNSMAHGGSDVKTIEEAKKLVLKTRAYETLFNRTFLRTLGYNDYYVDYYTASNKVRPITTPAGPAQPVKNP